MEIKRIALMLLLGVAFLLVAVTFVIPNPYLLKPVGCFCIGWCIGDLAIWISHKVWNKE